MKTIEQIKEEYPQYQNIPDVELAEKIYSKFYDGKINERDFYSKVFPNIQQKSDTEFFKEDAAFQNMSKYLPAGKELTIGQIGQIKDQSFKPTVKQIAEKSGVSADDPASNEARFAASLGYNKEQKQLAIKKVLSNLYKQDIDVRKGSNTGELEYLNPKTQKYSLVNKPGVDLGDFTGMSGDAMVILPDLAVTLGVGLASGGSLAIPSGAAAAFAGEYSRLMLGQKLYGINKDLTGDQIVKKAALVAGISLGAGYAGVSVAKIVKGVDNLLKGRFVKGSDVAQSKVLDEIADADKVAETINKNLDKAKINSKLKFTLAQATDDADMLAAQQAFENVKRLGYMDEFRTFGRNQANALNRYFGFLKSGFNTQAVKGKVISEFDAGKLIQDVIVKRNQPVIRDLIAKQSQAENILEKSVINLPDGSLKQTGVTIRSAIDDAAGLYKKKVDEAAKLLEVAAGVKTIPSNLISDTIAKLSAKEKANLLKTKKVESFFKKPKTDPLDEGIVKEEFKLPSEIPIETARNTLSTLNKMIRDKEMGLAAGESVDVGVLKQLVKSINKQLRLNAPKEYIDQLDNFNRLVIQNKQKLNNAIIAEITRTDNKLKVFGDEDVFGLTFKKGKGSQQTAERLHDVIKEYPDAMTAYKNSIFDFYKSKTLKDGIPSLNKHNQFLKDYDAPLKMFFSKGEYNQISKIGGLKKVVDNATKLRDDTVKQIVKSFEGKLEKLTPGELVNKIYKPNNIGEILELKKILKNDPDVYKAFQRNILSHLNENTLKNSDRLGTRIIDSKAFDKYLNGSGGERGYRVALKEIFDVELVNNLDILNKALQYTGRKAPSRAAEGMYGNAFSDIIRARLGQFTLWGRLFTASRRIYAKASERVMANALLNPTSLKELIELRKLKPSSARAAYILGKLGGSMFIKDEKE